MFWEMIIHEDNDIIYLYYYPYIIVMYVHILHANWKLTCTLLDWLCLELGYPQFPQFIMILALKLPFRGTLRCHQMWQLNILQIHFDDCIDGWFPTQKPPWGSMILPCFVTILFYHIITIFHPIFTVCSSYITNFLPQSIIFTIFYPIFATL